MVFRENFGKGSFLRQPDSLYHCTLLLGPLLLFFVCICFYLDITYSDIFARFVYSVTSGETRNLK